MAKVYLFFLLLISAGCGSGSFKNDMAILEGPGIVSENGMVVSAHPESSRIGVRILMEGGNAWDAAVATGFAIAVCYPEAGNLGGGGFMVSRKADGTVNSLDFREKAPLSADRYMFLDASNNVIRGMSTETAFASGVPGTVAGLIEMHRLFGRLPLKKLVHPAVDLAEKGFTLHRGQAEALNNHRKDFLERNRGKTAFVREIPWQQGDTLVQADLARTLRLIRDRGRDGFYKGETARLIAAQMKLGFGLITEKDLMDYDVLWRVPVTGFYRGHKIITIPPPSAGGVILLQVLTMIEDYQLKDPGFHSAECIHLVAEAERRAFADRSYHLGDPSFVFIPLSTLLHKNYLKDRMESFSHMRATPSDSIRHGSVNDYETEETTHYSVVDGEGNAVAVTTTLNGTYGSCIVVEGAGFLLNNEMDDFSIKPGYPNMYGLTGGEANSIKPGKRMLSSMTPAIVEKDSVLLMVLGSPGGSTIPTSVLQVVNNVIDYGMDMQEAVNAGRFHHQWYPDQISFEKDSIDQSVMQILQQKGHTLRSRGSIGRVNAIMKLPEGKLKAGADPRGDNAAAAY